jgi:diamine N-acetyltransferase
MRIRPATEADIPILRSLAQRIWREVYPAIITSAQIEFMLERMYGETQLARELDAGVPWEIAEEHDDPIGFLSYEFQQDGRVKLHKLYLLPAFHGRGLGQQMIAHVIEQAARLGGSEVWMQVNKRNTSAIAAYQRAGFHIAQEAIFDIGDGFVMDDYLMARAIE